MEKKVAEMRRQQKTMFELKDRLAQAAELEDAARKAKEASPSADTEAAWHEASKLRLRLKAEVASANRGFDDLAGETREYRWTKETAPYRVPGYQSQVPKGTQTITPKDIAAQRENLLGQIADALKTTPDGSTEKITLSVPGDGEFVAYGRDGLENLAVVVKKHFPKGVGGVPAPSTPSGKPTPMPKLPGKAVPPEEVQKTVAPFLSSDEDRPAIHTAYADGTQIVATDGRQMLRIVTKSAPGTPANPVRIDAKGQEVEVEHDFPNYNQLWSESPDLVKGGAKTDELWTMANQTQAIWDKPSDKEMPTVRLYVNPDGSIGASSKRAGIGEYEHNVQNGAKSLGDYNPDYVVNAAAVARRLGNAHVDLYFHGSEGAIEFRGKNHASLIMPQKLSGRTTTRDSNFAPSDKVHGELPLGLGPLKNPEGELSSGAIEGAGGGKWSATLEKGKFKIERFIPKSGSYSNDRWTDEGTISLDDFSKLKGKPLQEAIAEAAGGTVENPVGAETVNALSKAMGDLAKQREGLVEEGRRRSAPPSESNPNVFMIGLPIPALKPLLTHLQKLRGVLKQRLLNIGARHEIDQAADAADNKANIVAQRMGNKVAIGITDVQNVAAAAVIAAKFHPGNLPALLAIAAGKNPTAEAGIRYAMANFGQAASIAHRGRRVFDWQIAMENAHGINTLYTENYLPGMYDTDLWMGHSRPFVLGGGGGMASGFKKGKTYESPFHAIADDYVPKSLKLSDLVEHRVKSGQKLLNRQFMAEGLKSLIAPSDGRPVAANMILRSRGPGLESYEVAPVGYTPREVLPGKRIAIHEDFAKLFDAVTGLQSKISEFEPGGLPLGEAALQTEGAIKHGLLVFDTFHASRIMQKQMFLTRGLPSYTRGHSLLEYNPSDLGRAVAAGEITPEIAAWVRVNRPRADMIIRHGLNVGRIQEAMYSGFVRSMQEHAAKAARAMGVPKAIAEKIEFNKWVFEKVTRGAMLESSLIEFERVKRANPSMTDEQVASRVARQLNMYFGNLGRQGIFKSKTMLDASRLAMLAPQWVESMARSEILGAGQLAKAPIDSAMARRLKVGTLGSGLASGLVAYVFATQLINLVTRGHLTLSNPEKGHKFDAWIPDLTGKGHGFFVSPLSVVAELTHDMIRYAPDEKEKGGAAKLIAAADHIRRNRQSPLMRAAGILTSGRDWNDVKIQGAYDRVKSAAWSLAPTPIPLSPIIRGNAPQGQTQRQLTASLGVKTELAKTPAAEISSLARDWMEKSVDPKIRNKYERDLKSDFGQSDYAALRNALAKEDYASAWEAYQQLKQIKAGDVIAKSMRPYTVSPDGIIEHKPIVGLSREETGRFIRTLNPEQKKILGEARKEKAEHYKRFLNMLKNAPKGLPKTRDPLRVTA